MNASFATIWEGVTARLPDSVAIAEPGRAVTFREFDDRASRLAAALESSGVRPGETVACYLYNGAAYLETVFAAFKIGAIPVNANYRYNGRGTRHDSGHVVTVRDGARPEPARG